MKGFQYNHQLLKQRAFELNPNVTELCQKIGISRTRYYNVLNNKKSSPYTVALVAKALGVDPEEVLQFAVHA